MYTYLCIGRNCEIQSITVTPSTLWLTVRITYTQLGRVFHIFYDSSSFNFPRLSFAVLFQIYFMLDDGKCSLCKYHITPLWLHICTEKLQTRLTIVQSWPLEWCCLLSEWNWFPCTVPSQTAPAVWPLQTISPWTIRAKPQRRLNRFHGMESMNKSASFSVFNKICSGCPA